MTEVILHVYDVTSSASATTNIAVVHINKLLRGGIKLGGIFHSAVEVYDCEEWSFGHCGSGSGVFSCPHKGNPLYSYRESVSLGITTLSRLKVTQILFELGREWPGSSYDFLSRNCNHFCDAFCERLGVQNLPVWVNRFAHAGVAAVDAIETTIDLLQHIKSGIFSASKVVLHPCVRVNSTTADGPNSEGGQVHDTANRNGVCLSRWSILKAPSVCKLFMSMNCFSCHEDCMIRNDYVEIL